MGLWLSMLKFNVLNMVNGRFPRFLEDSCSNCGLKMSFDEIMDRDMEAVN